MLTLEQIKPYINTESGIDLTDTTHTTALLESACDYAEHYTNTTIDSDSPQGLVQCVADLMVYYHSIRPHLTELKTEDMALVFNTNTPKHLTNRMMVYRRVTW